MKNTFKKLSVILAFMAFSCDFTTDLQDPYSLTPAQLDVNYSMNLVQLTFADFYSGLHGTVAPLVRYNTMTGGYRYQNAYQPQNQDGLWTTAYQAVLNQTKFLIPLAEEKNLTTHVAVAKIINAYTLLAMVDLFGDIPLSEALNPANFNPGNDDGADVYAAALALLGEAKIELAKTGTDAGGPLNRDIYFGTLTTPANRAKWAALASTLELKAYVNLGDNAKIATYINTSTGALLPGVDLIDNSTPLEQFTYKYGTATNPAGSRHPVYDQYYGVATGSAGGYYCNYFLYEMFNGSNYTTDGIGGGTAVQDPRWRYYFYRQVGSIDPNVNGFDLKALGCNPGVPPPNYAGVPMFCVFEPGFYGRDHGDASGTPPDGPVITTAGVYPAAGRPDNTSLSNATYQGLTQRAQGGNGAGILPIWMPEYTEFLKAEIVGRAGNVAAAKGLLLSAINLSIANVKGYADSKALPVTIAPWTATTSVGWTNFVSSYTTAVGLAYDAASAKLDIIGKEFWKALHGNGYEAYNLYRRTSAPRNMQPTIQANPGPWMRALIYPSVHVNLNNNAPQRDANVVNKVFWDTNADTLN